MNKLILPYQAINVNSSAIKSATYVYSSYTLQLYYANGNGYTYKSVPNHVFEGLRTSESKGKFINRYVLGQYKFKRVSI